MADVVVDVVVTVDVVVDEAKMYIRAFVDTEYKQSITADLLS